MADPIALLRLARGLLAYPTAEQEEIWAHALELAGASEASAELQVAIAALKAMGLGDREEAYVRSFDLDPKATLEVGWHLFGEDYKRGEFLVTCRRLLRDHDIPEAGELPDHLGSLLPLLAALPQGERASFYASYLRPALAALTEALAFRQSPYAGVVRALAWAAEEAATAVPAGGGR